SSGGMAKINQPWPASTEENLSTSRKKARSASGSLLYMTICAPLIKRKLRFPNGDGHIFTVRPSSQLDFRRSEGKPSGMRCTTKRVPGPCWKHPRTEIEILHPTSNQRSGSCHVTHNFSKELDR